MIADLNAANKIYQNLEKLCKLDIEQLTDQNRENKFKLEAEFAKEKLACDNKLAGLQQELRAKINDYQNLQKYLNDVQNDRKEVIKQYELEIETYKADLKKAVDTTGEINEMKESHVFEVRDLIARSEDLKKQGEVKEAEYEATRRERQRVMTESG